MLAEVDRARQASNQFETGLAKEQQQRIQSEQAAQEFERELRDRLADQAALLGQAQSQGLALQSRVEDLERQLGEEKKSREDT